MHRSACGRLAEQVAEGGRLGEQVVVLHWNEWTSGMGVGFYPSLATLAGEDPLADTWEVVQHLDPVLGPSLSLRLVDGGGGPC